MFYGWHKLGKLLKRQKCNPCGGSNYLPKILPGDPRNTPAPAPWEYLRW
jgi:hypothetical protein